MKISPFSISLTHVPQFLRTQNFPSQLNWVKLKKKGYDNTDSNFEICYWFRGFFVAWNIESNFEICCLFEAFFIGAIRVEVGTQKSLDACEFSNLNGLLVIVMAILKSISFSDCALLNWQKMLLLFTTYAWIESKLYLELQYKNFSD